MLPYPHRNSLFAIRYSPFAIYTAAMAPTFFAQLAAGCLLVVGVSDIRNCGWKYLRLMALVSLALAFVALLLYGRPLLTAEALTLDKVTYAALGSTIIFAAVWLFMNSLQREAIRPLQRLWPLISGVACLSAAAALALQPDWSLPSGRYFRLIEDDAIQNVIATALGALVLGGVTAGMLLGHRYLTDTDMPIAPLRRLTNIYLVALIMRLIWVAVLAWPIYGGTFTPSGGAMWFWVVLTIRGGVGLLGAAIFAWMIRDCVKTRATQSATAIFYLSMVFVYLGELAAQYLLRTEGLPV